MALKCCVQTYAWGRRGSLSTVARLAQNNSEFQLDEETPYAEVRFYSYFDFTPLNCRDPFDSLTNNDRLILLLTNMIDQ